MAKAKTVKIKMTINADFNIDVPSDTKKEFEQGLKSGELGLNINMLAGDEIGMFSVYPNEFKDGSMTITKVSGSVYKCKLSGSVEKDLDLPMMQELFDYLKENSNAELEVTSLYDQDVNDYYIDGDEDKTINVGTACIG